MIKTLESVLSSVKITDAMIDALSLSQMDIILHVYRYSNTTESALRALSVNLDEDVNSIISVLKGGE